MQAGDALFAEALFMGRGLRERCGGGGAARRWLRVDAALSCRAMDDKDQISDFFACVVPDAPPVGDTKWGRCSQQ